MIAKEEIEQIISRLEKLEEERIQQEEELETYKAVLGMK